MASNSSTLVVSYFMRSAALDSSDDLLLFPTMKLESHIAIILISTLFSLFSFLLTASLSTSQ